MQTVLQLRQRNMETLNALCPVASDPAPLADETHADETHVDETHVDEPHAGGEDAVVVGFLEKCIGRLLSRGPGVLEGNYCVEVNVVCDYPAGRPQTSFDQIVRRDESLSSLSESLQSTLNAHILPHYRVVHPTFDVHLAVMEDPLDGSELLTIGCSV